MTNLDSVLKSGDITLPTKVRIVKAMVFSVVMLLQKSHSWETNHHTQKVGELMFITPADTEELALQALSPEQRGYKVFIDSAWHQTIVDDANS